MHSGSAQFDISRFFKVTEHTVLCQHIREYPRATATSQEDPLSIVAKQYVPWDNYSPSPGDISIVSAHANGIPKEVYEPLWVEVLHACQNAGVQIRGIWIADLANQGASGVLNEKKLGNDQASSFDHSRDLILMINQLRDKLPRPIFGIGHSMGGTQLMGASLMHPRLFQGLCVIEPIVSPYSAENQGRYPPAQRSMYRRDEFASLDIAISQFRANSAFRKWDARALHMWIKYGLRPAPGDSAGKVTLTTAKSQELFTFVRPTFLTKFLADRRLDLPDLPWKAPTDTLFYRPEPVLTFHFLPHLRPSILYVFGSHSKFISRPMRDSIAGKTGIGISGSGGLIKQRVKHITMRGVGHFAPMEDPRTLAENIASWLKTEVEKWAYLERSTQLEPQAQDYQDFLSCLAGHKVKKEVARIRKL